MYIIVITLLNKYLRRVKRQTNNSIHTCTISDENSYATDETQWKSLHQLSARKIHYAYAFGIDIGKVDPAVATH